MIAISIALLVTLVSMYLAGAIAQRRGRSAKIWVWIAVLLGPFAPALLLVLSPQPPAGCPPAVKGSGRSGPDGEGCGKTRKARGAYPPRERKKSQTSFAPLTPI